jgi:hypothetical protein
MKRFKLQVFGLNQLHTETVEAEAHTIENGMVIFWVKNKDDQWAQVALYPASCTAVVRIEEVNPIVEIPSQITNMPINITADVQEVLKELKTETKKPRK